MGLYYKLECSRKKEILDPGAINDLGMKLDPIAHPQHPFGPLAIFVMSRRWMGCQCRILCDDVDESYYADHSDVTEEEIAAYNHCYRHSPGFVPLRFTGRS